MMPYAQSAYPLLAAIPIVLFAVLVGLVFLVLSEREGKAALPWRTGEAAALVFTLYLLAGTLVQKNSGALVYLGEPWLDAYMLRRVQGAVPGRPFALLPLALTTGILLLAVGGRLLYLRYYRKPTLSRFSIKEGFDNLPSGACFADANGEIVLCNWQMHRICQYLLGSDLQHLSDLHTALANPPETVACVDEGKHIYSFPDQRLWRFSEEKIVDGAGGAYRQVQAFDDTDLYRAEQALKRENEELAAANARARALYRELDALVHEEERLAAQMQLHDALGRQLLYSRKCLTDNAPLDILRKNGDDWVQAAMFLQTGAENAPAPGDEPESYREDSLAQLLRSAHEIGVDIKLKGQLPADEKAAYLLLVAIRECTTNTARHAFGSEMTVQVTQTEATVTAAITNNGKAPEAPIREGGGLTALRRRVERAGGTMGVQSLPRFELRITLPVNTKQEGTL